MKLMKPDYSGRDRTTQVVKGKGRLDLLVRYCIVPALAFFAVGCVDLSAMLVPADPPSATPVFSTTAPQTPPIDETIPSLATEAGDTPPLLFVSGRGKEGTTDIYQINADGSGLRRLTSDPAMDRDPRWSPDRKWIAFTSDRTGSNQIFIMSTEDYGVEQLTDHPDGAVSPTWLPGGKRLAYVEAPESDKNAITIVSTETGEGVTILSMEAEALANPVWSPIENSVAFSGRMEGHSGNRDIYVYDVDKGLLANLTNDPFNDDNPAWSPDGKRLIYQTNRDGDENIYIMNANGSLQTPLTTNPSADVEPSWSSDGRLIAFGSDRDGPFNIYTMRENGSDQEVLAPFPADDRQPQWPSRGAQASDGLLYAGGILTDFRDLHLTNAEGTTRVQLTESDNSDDTIPDWSPDGTQIAFTSSRSGNYDIYIMQADGTGVNRLTTNTGDDKHPSWSPDGTKIAFESKQGDVDWDVWVMDAGGGNPRNLTADEDGHDGNPAYSPDGTEIAFSSNRDGNFEIYVMKADGSDNPTRLTETEVHDFHPDWSPDGSLIVFRSESIVAGNRQIVVMSRDGDSPRPLFPSLANDDTPAWSPDGQRIAFASDRANQEELSPVGSYRIYIYDLDTGRLTAVTHGNRDGRYPAWRPRR